MEIELRHLRYFIAVADERHFGRAARRLHIAQPPLSRQIRNLEEELGAELLDRKSRPLRLTAAGAAFREEAWVLLDRAERAIDRWRLAPHEQVGHLNVAVLPWAYGGMLPSLVGTFGARAPHVSLELSTRSVEEQLEALAKDWIDVGLGRAVRAGRTLRVEALLTERTVAVVPESHRLTDRSEISLEDLAGEPLVSIARRVTPGFAHRQDDLFLSRGLTPTIVHEAPDPQAQLALVAAGVGAGLHLASISEPVRHRGVAFIPLSPEPPPVTLTALWRRDDDRELLRLFLETAREVAGSAGWPR